jgi:hypothetical protein
MGGMRRNTANDNIVFKTMLHDFERLVRPEAVTNKNPWFLIRRGLVCGSNTSFIQLQADLGVGVSRLGARKMRSMGGERSPGTSVGCGWPDNQWKETPTVCRNALDRSHHCPLNTRASISSQVILTYKGLEGATHA